MPLNKNRAKYSVMTRGTVWYVVKRALLVAAFLVAVALIGWLPNLTPDYVEAKDTLLPVSIESFIASRSEWLALGAGLVIWILPHPRSLFRTDKEAQAMRDGILKEIGDDIFDGRLKGLRVTLFSEAGPFRNAFAHVVTYFKFMIWPTRSIWNCPAWGRFIVIRGRESSEDSRIWWRTMFYCHPQDPDQCEGVATRSMRTFETVSVENLPDIKGINLKDFGGLSEDEKRRVAEYKGRSFINDLETLRQINMPCRHIWANVVYNQDGKPIGALVIDSHNEDSFLTEEVDQKLSTYVNALKHSFVEDAYA